MKNYWLGLLALVLAPLLIYVALEHDSEPSYRPSLLRIGVLPDESEAMLRQHYEPLLDYLSRATGLQTQLVLPKNYNELIKMFAQHKIDLAYFGGLTFVQANTYHNAEPLVMREVDTHFTSWIFARGDTTLTNLQDYSGRSFSFGSRLSTSGHLMPRHFLEQEHKIEAEKFFTEVHYSGAHDQTAYRVRSGEVDLGAANSRIIKQMIHDGRLKDNDLRVLWQTPPYPDYVWAVDPHLAQPLKQQLRDAFLALHPDDPAQAQLLKQLGARIFLPAASGDFISLRKIAKRLKLLSPS